MQVRASTCAHSMRRKSVQGRASTMCSARNAKEGDLRGSVPWKAAARSALVAAAVLATGCSLVPADGGRLRIEEVERALLPMASVAVDTGQLETAERLYRRLLDVDPESFEAHMGLGDVAFKGRRSEEAARWYLGALTVAAKPEDRHEALLWHGRAALEAGRLVESRRSFQQLTEAREQAPARSIAWAFNGVGLTRLLEGDLPGAVAAMRWAVRHAPNEPMFAENLDRASAMLGEQRRRGMAELAERPRTVARTTQPTVSQLVPDVPAAAPRQTPPRTPVPREPSPAPSEPAAEPRTPPPAPTAFDGQRPPTLTPQVPTARVPTATVPTSAPAEGPETALVVSAPEVPPTSPARPSPTRGTTGATPRSADRPAAPGVEWLDARSTAAARPATAPTASVGAATVVRVGGQSFVQVGAFERFAAADAASKRLAEITGAAALVALSESRFRVRIGPLASEAALDAVVRALATTGYAVQDAPDARRVARSDANAAVPAPRSGEGTRVAWQNIAGDVLPAVGAATPPPATAGLVVEEEGQRFVQLGAFATREKARELASRMRGLTTAPVQIDPVQRRGETLHRVRIGPLETDAALAELAAATKAAGYAIE